MPPKPFNPPRPTGEPKKAGRPKGSTNSKPRKSDTSKPAKDKVAKSKAKKVSDAKRLSDAALARLGTLSSDDGEGVEDGEEDSDIEMADPAPKKRKNAAAPAATAVESTAEEETDDPFSSQPTKSKKKKSRPEEPDEPSLSRKEAIPGDLLNVLLHEFFKNKGKGGTRMSKEANQAVGKYVDTFVREAVARAAWEGEERRGGGGMGSGGGGGGGVLEVEDLERLGPQMLLDF